MNDVRTISHFTTITEKTQRSITLIIITSAHMHSRGKVFGLGVTMYISLWLLPMHAHARAGVMC